MSKTFSNFKTFWNIYSFLLRFSSFLLKSKKVFYLKEHIVSFLNRHGTQIIQFVAYSSRAYQWFALFAQKKLYICGVSVSRRSIMIYFVHYPQTFQSKRIKNTIHSTVKKNCMYFEIKISQKNVRFFFTDKLYLYYN